MFWFSLKRDSIFLEDLYDLYGRNSFRTVLIILLFPAKFAYAKTTHLDMSQFMEEPPNQPHPKKKWHWWMGRSSTSENRKQKMHGRCPQDRWSETNDADKLIISNLNAFHCHFITFQIISIHFPRFRHSNFQLRPVEYRSATGGRIVFFLFPATVKRPCPLGEWMGFCQANRPHSAHWLHGRWSLHRLLPTQTKSSGVFVDVNLMMFFEGFQTQPLDVLNENKFLEDFLEGSWNFERNVCVVLVYWSSHVILGPLLSAGLVRVWRRASQSGDAGAGRQFKHKRPQVQSPFEKLSWNNNFQSASNQHPIFLLFSSRWNVQNLMCSSTKGCLPELRSTIGKPSRMTCVPCRTGWGG